jgi:hypothetical protein
MIPKGSRYEEAETHSVLKHFYDQYGHPILEDVEGNLRFVQSSADATYLLNILLPSPPQAEYYAKAEEHFPFLAYKFLDDSTRWWEVAEVNPKIWYPLDLMMGDYLRIPS